MADLVIKINGDVKDFQKALKDAQEQSGELEDQLSTVAKTSAIAFAALVAEVALSAKAFGEAQQASIKLTQAMQNQGVYSKALFEDYQKWAQAVQTKTGLDDDEVTAAQGKIQSLIGQQKVTKDLTFAMADLSTQTGGLEGAAEVLGKAIEGNVRGLRQFNIHIDEGLSKQERYRQVLQAVQQQYGGFAEAQNKGLGSIKGLITAFGNFQEAIGSKFAPIITQAIKLMTELMTEFFAAIAENKEMANLAASLLTTGLALSGIIAVGATAAVVILKIRAAMIAAEVSISATALATKGLVAATGLGALILIGSEIYLHWSSIWPRMQGVFAAFVEGIKGLASGLGTLIYGAFHGDLAKLKEGWEKIKQAFADSIKAYNVVSERGIKERHDAETAAEEKQSAVKAAIAKREEDRKRAQEARELAAEEAHRNVIIAKLQGRGKEFMQYAQEEADILGQMADEKNAKIRGQLQEHLDEVRRQKQQAAADEFANQAVFNQEILMQNEEFQAMTDEQKALFKDKYATELESQLMTDRQARDLMAQENMAKQVQYHNNFLVNQKKFGTAYAMIDKMMHSEIYAGSKSAFGDLAELQTSSNAQLKSIGKVAAVANIIMKTAESAMNIYAGFSTIPIVGPALGVAGAAAAVAFGAEQVGKVTAAADGGLMTGGRRGYDSIPTITEPGEVVTPTRNYDELINSVADQRVTARLNQGPGEDVFARVEISLKNELMDFIELKTIERRKLGISLLGS